MDAQIVLKGKVTCQNKDVPFINVSLFAASDTTKFFVGTVTDTHGEYILSNVTPGKYKVVISGLTYNTLNRDVILRMPMTGTIVTKDFLLTNNEINLAGVTVTGRRTTNYLNKSVYTFTEEQIKSARYANDLVANLPKVVIDPETSRLKNLGGGSIKILINGVNATDNDLKSIAPDKILKVEYYDIPPARYADVKTLVNVITRRLDTGWNGGFDANQALSTGFGNDNAYLTYVMGRSQFSFDYELNFRDYKDRWTTENYAFHLDDKDWRYHYKTKDSFGYTTNNINLKYTNSLKDNYTFQAIFSPNFDTSFSHGNSDIDVKMDSSDALHNGTIYRKVHSFGPALDLYFSKELKHNQELSVDMIGTVYHNKQRKNNDETVASTGQSVFSDHMLQNNDKQSVIGEMAYTKTLLGGSTFSAGYKGTFVHSAATITNFLSGDNSYKYGIHNYIHYGYLEYVSQTNHLMYSLGLGGTIDHSKNDEAHYTNYMFNPKITIGYTFSHHQEIRLMVDSDPIEPTLSDLSDNIELIATNIVHRGNPQLKSGNDYGGALTYKWTNPSVELDLIGALEYTYHPINTYYSQKSIAGEDYIVSTTENARELWEYGGVTNILFRPFKNNVLTVKIVAGALRDELNSQIVGHYAHWSMPMDYSIDFRKGSWGASYQGNIVSREISGAYLQATENKSKLQLFWQKKNVRCFAECLWFLTKAKYNHETIPNSVLHYDYHNHINDNKSMITLGLSWNFSKGKSHKIDRELQNKDTDKGIF